MADKGVALKIEGSVALVTGANRGLGRAFARELLKRGAQTVYEITELQLEGAKRMPAAEFLRGHAFAGNDVLGKE